MARYAALFVLAFAVAPGPACAQEQSAAVPSQPAPATAPPPPQAKPSPPPQEQHAEPPVPPPAVPRGQWVYTAQYGWVWMPYAQQYTYVSDYGDTYMFVYYPAYGWRWVAAPWIFDVGPRPYWGPWGVTGFVWYSHPWFWGGRYYYGGYRHRPWRYAPHREWVPAGRGGGMRHRR